MLGISVPHPSYGFLTATEFDELRDMCPSKTGRKADILKNSKSRKAKYKKALREVEQA